MTNINRPPKTPYLTPYLIVPNAEKSIDFYKKVFHFTLKEAVHDEKNEIAHVEMNYQEELILMFSVEGKFGNTNLAPISTGNTSVQSMYLYVDNVDACHDRALSLGGKSIQSPEDSFWGDRFALITDINGYTWGLASPSSDNP